MYALFNSFDIKMTKVQAQSASHQGQCDLDVSYLAKDKKISRQLDKIGPEKIRRELKEYGAWSDEQLMDDDENRLRIVWIAAGNIMDELK